MEQGNGLVFILSAPSGTGKTTLIRKVMQRLGGLQFSVSHTTRSPRASCCWEALSSSEPNCANASRARNCARSKRKRPATFFIALIWADPPTRLTEMPTFIAGRTPEKNNSDSKKICPSVIDITLVGM